MRPIFWRLWNDYSCSTHDFFFAISVSAPWRSMQPETSSIPRCILSILVRLYTRAKAGGCLGNSGNGKPLLIYRFELKFHICMVGPVISNKIHMWGIVWGFLECPAQRYSIGLFSHFQWITELHFVFSHANISQKNWTIIRCNGDPCHN